MDVQKYLNRIGISKIFDNSIDSLNNLQSAHLLKIPFENLDIHYGEEIELNIPKLFDKIITNERGGFCYELNGLFYELLISLGFNVKRISAKVYNKEKSYGKEFDHLALLVKIDNDEYLTDVGFGEFTMASLKFELTTKQKDENGIFFFDKYDDEYFKVNKVINDEVIPQYIFKTKSRNLHDFNSMCRFHQTSKDSHFAQNKIITLPTENGRMTLSSDKLKIRSADKIEEITVNSESEFNNYLLKHFQIRKL